MHIGSLNEGQVDVIYVYISTPLLLIPLFGSNMEICLKISLHMKSSLDPQTGSIIVNMQYG